MTGAETQVSGDVEKTPDGEDDGLVALAAQVQVLEERLTAIQMIVGIISANSSNPKKLISAIEFMRKLVENYPDRVMQEAMQAFVNESETILKMIRASVNKDG